MDENMFIKLICTGLSIVGITFIIMMALILVSNPIPDLIARGFTFGIAATVIPSVALSVMKNKKRI